MVDAFSAAVGRVLRRARRDRGLTLRDLARVTGGRFKPSAVGGYERGVRAISLRRFCELARVYGMSPDGLLAQVMAEWSPESRRELVLDLNRLSLIEEEGRAVAEFVHRVKAQRGDYMSDVVTLRSGDLEVLAARSGRSPRALLERLQPALREEGAAPG